MTKDQYQQYAEYLFPTWKPAQVSAWVTSRLLVDNGTYRFPVGEKHVGPTDVPQFLHKLPPGPPLEIPRDTRDNVRAVVQFTKQLIHGRRR